MDFRYGTSFGRKLPEAYERLLLDAMLGDSTLFARGDTVELCWEIAHADSGGMAGSGRAFSQLPGRQLGTEGKWRIHGQRKAAAGGVCKIADPLTC